MRDSILESGKLDAANPSNRVSFVLGDFNFLPENEGPRALGKMGGSNSAASSYRNACTQFRTFESALGQLGELHQPLPTRYNEENMQVTRLGRVYTSLPGSLIIRFNISANIICSPEGMHYEDLGDHSPLEVCVSNKHTVKKGQGALPIQRCLHTSFKERLSDLMQYVNFSGLSPFERLKPIISVSEMPPSIAEMFSLFLIPEATSPHAWFLNLWQGNPFGLQRGPEQESHMYQHQQNMHPNFCTGF